MLPPSPDRFGLTARAMECIASEVLGGGACSAEGCKAHLFLVYSLMLTVILPVFDSRGPLWLSEADVFD